MNILEEFLTSNIYAWMLIFARVGTAFVLLPGFSAPYVDVRMRVAIALALSLLLMPSLVGKLPTQPVSVLALTLLFTGEILVGAFLGVVGRVLVGALQTAGVLLAMFASLANALTQDPIVEQQSATVATLLSTIGLVLVFATDLHHLMLVAVADSYSLFDPNTAFQVGDVADLLAHKVDDSFAIGLQLSAPFLIVSMTYYVGLGMISRLSPQMQAFFFAAMPLQIMVQIAVLTMTLSSIMLVFLRYFQDGFTPFLAP
ncbi:MAG: flagellar biosynthetic protein FliR [Magnetospirillum sp. WYHS-4]